ncbi:hypothetical protein HELRODRAFT_87192 [Helobdella robusta]|uniref:Uncharacterized protein n=1 Tax=Helobdella robusta TaxID=6412 RepID=T1G6N0_HELRO|nr:hypothetical protein HELRODRAFT_87192 [Helobdella robusta]ESN94987.1 hypothetical protein HELRODRAFT_87192 [Helobdella robusta]
MTEEDGNFLNYTNIGDAVNDDFETWTHLKSTTLSTFTTSKKLSLVSITSSKDHANLQGSKTLVVTVADKVKKRLEQLDDIEEGSVQETLTLSQDEYVGHINKLSSALVHAWKVDQRVKTLKIAIQCVKLLGDTSSKQFYPSKFILIADILDNFGALVLERLLEKSTTTAHQHLPNISLLDINPNMVSEPARETCRNWIFKISSIRELLPRIYVEASVLRCLDLLGQQGAVKELDRLLASVRGVADPLVSLYLRCYLVKVADSLVIHRQQSSSSFFSTSSGFVHCMNGLATDSTSSSSTLSDEEKMEYLLLFSPAFDWIMRCIASSTTDILGEVYNIITACQDEAIKSLLIGSFIDQSPSLYLVSQSIVISRMIGQLMANEKPLPELYRRLGSRLATSPDSLDEEFRRPLLNDSWRCLSGLYSASEYMKSVIVWSAYVGRFFTKKECNVVMADVIKRMMMDRSYEDEQTSIKLTMQHLVSCSNSSLVDIVSSASFLPYLDMFNSDNKVCCCYYCCCCVCSIRMTSDPVVIHAMMTICKYFHDHVNAMTSDDEVRDVSTLINDFIGAVSTESNEAQLAFYVKCRSTFYNIDPILAFLVHRVNHLVMEGRESSDERMKSRTKTTTTTSSVKKKDFSFVRACCAYTFITIPSLNGVLERVNMYVGSGLVALHHVCVSQADDFFRAAILLISQVPKFVEFDGKIHPTDPQLVDCVRNLSSIILFLPDPPHLPPLSLYHLLFSQVSSYKWDPNFDSQLMAYASLIVSLSSVSQEILPYKMANVDSNDALYGGDPKFLAEVGKLVGLIAEQVQEKLRDMERTRVAVVALKMFETLLPHVDPSSSPFLHYLLKLIVAGTCKGLPTSSRKAVTTTAASSTSTSMSVMDVSSPSVNKVVASIRRMVAKDERYRVLLEYVVV